MADLADVKPVERTIEIKHPGSGADLGVKVTLCSVDDERLKKIRRQITDKRLKLERSGKSFDADDLERNRLEIRLASMVAWEWYNPTGVKGDDGYDEEAMPSWKDDLPVFNRKNVSEVLSELSWFADQVDEALGETDAFFKNSKSI